MIPHDLNPRKVKLPETGEHSIVLITGDSLRHRRFAYHLQKEFGDQVLAWFQFKSGTTLKHYHRREKLLRLFKKAKYQLLQNYKFKDIYYYIRVKGLFKSITKALFLIYSLAQSVYISLRLRRSLIFYEQKLFQQEIEELKSDTSLLPQAIKDPNSQEFIEQIKKLNPYFFLSAGGPLYKKELLASIRGVAINLHAGWSPVLKGSYTIEWALYHRNLHYVGSTVHLTTTGADAGPILRRSQPCLLSADTPETCFLRSVAVGTELVIEVVREIMADKGIMVYDQPPSFGLTYLRSQLTKDVLKAIYGDFSNNWLQNELSRTRNF
ncbi:formyltransferase family protein [Candidatus Margulisiibacteriota bacterium]